MVEANYEFEHNGGTDGGTTGNLRRLEWWTAFSGTTGQLYGSAFSWRLDGDWEHNLDTDGIRQFSYVKKLLTTLPWWSLVPDRAHTVLTKGYGKYSSDDAIPDDTYATAAATPDGTWVLAYLPNRRKVTIDMSKLAGQTQAFWFDPTNQATTFIGNFTNTGTQDFTPPAHNHDGDSDWVLMLEAVGTP
jgi:hypothetical protein